MWFMVLGLLNASITSIKINCRMKYTYTGMKVPKSTRTNSRTGMTTIGCPIEKSKVLTAAPLDCHEIVPDNVSPKPCGLATR